MVRRPLCGLAGTVTRLLPRIRRALAQLVARGPR